MVDIYMLPAYEGDCLLIRYGTTNKHNILVDGGVSINKNDISDIIEYIYDQGEKLDIIVSHIDGDHIQGLISGINEVADIKLQSCVSSVYFNHRKSIAEKLLLEDIPSEGAAEDLITVSLCSGSGYSVSEAVSLMGILKMKGLESKIDGYVDFERTITIADATLKVISPSEKELKALITEWTAEADGKLQQNVGYSSKFPKDLDKDLAELMSEKLPPADNNVTNKSSIAFIFEYEDVKVVFLGDAVPSVICNGLEAHGIQEPLQVDAIKVSHHGSSRNISHKLLTILQTDTYLMSTNGKTLHGQRTVPGKTGIAHILKNRDGEDVHIVCNYDWWDICYQDNFFSEKDKHDYLETNKLRLHSLAEQCVSIKEGLNVYGEWDDRCRL